MSAAQTIAALQAPTAPIGTIDFEKGHLDAPLLAAFNARQKALAEIEQVGSFYCADDRAPEKVAIFDTLENSIPKMPCRTAKGLMAKLWIALAHSGPFCSTDEIRCESDSIRRADFGECEAFAERMDFDQQVIFHAIRDIRQWLQAQQRRAA